MSDPLPAVLAERICSLSRRIDDRFAALAKASDLESVNHRASLATWLSILAVAASFMVAIVEIIKR